MILGNVRKNRDGQYLLSRIAARLIEANAEEDNAAYLDAWSIIYDLSADMDNENGLDRGTAFSLFHAVHWPVDRNEKNS